MMARYKKEPVEAIQVQFPVTIHFDGADKVFEKGWWLVQNGDGSQHVLRNREFQAMYTLDEPKGT